MKHFADYTGSEYVTFLERPWNGMKRIQRKSRAEVKTGYRRRERAALKRMTAELVAEELHGHKDERGYWERKAFDAAAEYAALWDAEERIRESGEWTEEHTRIFAAAYREVNMRRRAYELEAA